MRDLQGLRPHDGDRPRARGPRSAADPRGRRDQAVPDELLQRLPGRPRAVPEALRTARERAVRGAAGRHEAPRLGRRAGRAPELAQEVVRRQRLLRVARVAQLPHARARAALALPQLSAVPRLRRRAAKGRGAALPSRRPHAAGGRGAARGRSGAVAPRVGRALARRAARRRLGAAAPGSPRAAALPGRRRARLPDARPPVADALGRRGAAGHARDGTRRLAHQHALRARRAVGGTARARRRAARGRAAAAGRRRQRRGGGRARARARRVGGPRDRPRPRPGPRGRRARVRGAGRGAAGRAALRDRGVPEGRAGPRRRAPRGDEHRTRSACSASGVRERTT